MTSPRLEEETPPGGLLRLVRELPPEDGLEILARAVERAAVHADRAAHHSEGARLAVAALEGRILQHRADTHTEIDHLTVRVLRELALVRQEIGRAPTVIDPRESRPGDHTSAQLAVMESGTGILGVLGALSAEVSRLRADFRAEIRREAVTSRRTVAAVAAAAPVIVELAKGLL